MWTELGSDERPNVGYYEGLGWCELDWEGPLPGWEDGRFSGGRNGESGVFSLNTLSGDECSCWELGGGWLRVGVFMLNDMKNRLPFEVSSILPI